MDYKYNYNYKFKVNMEEDVLCSCCTSYINDYDSEDEEPVCKGCYIELLKTVPIETEEDEDQTMDVE